MPNLVHAFFPFAVIAILLTTLGLRMTADARECPAGAPQHAPDTMTRETCPSIGHMGALKLAVPQHYILGPDFVYEGVDIWNAESYKNRPKQQSFDLPIRYFSIRIKLNNFKPVESWNDQQDFDAYMNAAVTLPPPENQWIFAQFDYPSIFKKDGKDVDLRMTAHNFINWMSPRLPALQKQPDDIAELEHYVSPLNPSTDTPVGEINEVFYDRKSNHRIIYCSNLLRRVPPYNMMTSCHHLFYINNGAISVNVNMIKDKQNYLSHWKEVEKGLSELFETFIVQ